MLPGIGHFTLLDHATVSPADAGNNFFLHGPASIGHNRAEEAVRLLAELNDGVDARADTRDVADVLASDPSYFFSFSLIITHNLAPVLLTRLADLLWRNPSSPPLIPVRSAGFLADFFLQFHNHESAWFPPDMAIACDRVRHSHRESYGVVAVAAHRQTVSGSSRSSTST